MDRMTKSIFIGGAFGGVIGGIGAMGVQFLGVGYVAAFSIGKAAALFFPFILFPSKLNCILQNTMNEIEVVSKVMRIANVVLPIGGALIGAGVGYFGLRVYDHYYSNKDP